MSTADQNKEISSDKIMGEIKCKLIEGKSITGLLDKPFHPMEGEVSIRNEGKVRVLPLDKICCIVFIKGPGELCPPHMPGEVVEIRGKEVYTVRVL